MTRHEYQLYGAKSCAKRGNELPQAKLNPDLVREIRKNVKGLTARQWAVKLNLHLRTIESVRSRARWAHVI